jgi:hypothetical protein
LAIECSKPRETNMNTTKISTSIRSIETYHDGAAAPRAPSRQDSNRQQARTSQPGRCTSPDEVQRAHRRTQRPARHLVNRQMFVCGSCWLRFASCEGTAGTSANGKRLNHETHTPRPGLISK